MRHWVCLRTVSYRLKQLWKVTEYIYSSAVLYYKLKLQYLYLTLAFEFKAPLYSTPLFLNTFVCQR